MEVKQNHQRVMVDPMLLKHPGKLRPYSTSAIRQAASSGLEGFGNFGRLHSRIKEGGHLPYEG